MLYSVTSQDLTCYFLKSLHFHFWFRGLSIDDHNAAGLSLCCWTTEGKTVGDAVPTFLISPLLCSYTGAVSLSRSQLFAYSCSYARFLSDCRDILVAFAFP